MAVWVQAGARKSEAVGKYQGCVKIRLQAPAVYNKALVAFVAKFLNLKQSQVAIKAGHANRKKRLALNAAGEPDWRKPSRSPNRDNL